MANFTTNTTLTDLLNEAQRAANTKYIGAPMTPTTLEALAAHVKGVVLTQAALGRWRPLGVVDPDDLVDLVVTAEFGNPLKGEPPICVKYDFTKTARPDICVELVKGKS